MEGKGTCSRDLLELEDKDLSASSSAMESALLVCKGKKKREEAPSRPTIGPVLRSRFLDEADGLKGFLGKMAEANKILEQKAKENPQAVDIEAVTGDESQFIEMDLMLGVADLNTPEAVNAAEAAIAGNGLATKSGDSSSSDESDDSNDEDGEEKKSSSGEECSRKRTKIIELS